MGWKHSIGRLGVGLAIGCAVVAVPVATASAAPKAAAVAPAAAPAPAFESDGCTGVPDSGYTPTYFNFYNACYWHDWCYTYHPYGDGSAGRLACDNGFRDRMRSWCYNQYSRWWQAPARWQCYGVADTYYNGVRLLGASHF